MLPKIFDIIVMKRKLLALMAFLLLSSHDMYLKMDTYFFEPNSEATIQLFNGTFEKSENVIDRDRMVDVSLIGKGERMRAKTSQWREKDSITLLDFTTGEPGTWVAGVSTAPRNIEMDAEAFNSYLEHDGVLDMLEYRRENGELEEDAIEEYSKHVKTIFQVGEQRSDDWKTALGYPIEFVPLSNPYDLNTGDTLQVQLLYEGKPLADQLVYTDYKATGDGHSHGEESGHSRGEGHDNGEKAGHIQEKAHTHDDASAHSHEGDHKANEDAHAHSHGEKSEHSHGEAHSHGAAGEHTHESGHSHGQEGAHTHDDGNAHSHGKEGDHTHDTDQKHSHKNEEANEEETHQHTSGSQLRTDGQGTVTVPLTADGIWYLRTINLVKSEAEGLTHESNWATLTFEVVHGHGEDTHTHDETDEAGIPSYVFWVGSIVLLSGLFFFFNRGK